MFQSTKIFDGYSTCFRQWKATETHCKFLHGYSVYFKVWFEGELDEKNWVFDFGRAKRSPIKIDGLDPKSYLEWLLDHTLIIAEDDPEFSTLMDLNTKGIAKVRVLPNIGAERFAEFLFNKLNPWVIEDTEGRVRITKIEFFEHGKNSAIFKEHNKFILNSNII